MKKLFAPLALAAALGSLLTSLQSVCAQGTAFTYQGRLNNNGAPANGSYDLTFTLFNTSSGGSATVGPLTNTATGVTNGLFTVTLNFGPNVLGGADYWLDMTVRTNGSGAFTELSPRQPITPAPYAIYSENSGAANSVVSNSVSASQLNTLGPPSSGEVLTYSGSGLVWSNAAGGSSGWSLTGNAGTSPGTDFLGTTDNTALQLRVNNTVGLALYPEANNTINLAVGPGAEFAIGAQGVNVFGGYYGGFNTVYPNYSTIAGGYNNTINPGAPESFIAGGQGNVIGGSTSSIGGGYFNTNNGYAGAIPGGADNLVTGSYGFAAGNTAQAVNTGAFVWADDSGGAFASTSNNQFSVRALGGVRFVTGGAGMTVDGVSVGAGGGGGGAEWSLTGNAGTVPGTDFLGTTDNEPLELWVNGMEAFRLEPANGEPNVIGGSDSSSAAASGGTIGGGVQNTVSNLYPTVGGGEYNTAGANGATVGGGYNNTATGAQSTIAGGAQNSASGAGAVVGGGGYDGTTFTPNTATGGAATVAGGLGNSAFYYAAVGGGQNNNAATYYSAVAGGYGNSTAGGGAGFVGAGYNNSASGFAAAVPGGVGNTASGGYSFAGGSEAQAVNNGSFVWSDDSSGASFASTADNQFNVRAYGGVRFVTGGAGMTIDGVAVGSGGGGGASASNAWLLTGNFGADPGLGYFLGTADTNALELHVNAERGLRLDYASEQVVPDSFDYNYGINVTGGYWGNTISNGVIGGTIAGGGSESRFGLQSYYYPNSVDGDFGTIGGGYGNDAGDYSTISGGYNNFAGNYSTIPGGYNNYAVGNGSFALGRSASTSYDGTFVWSDGTSIEYANGPNQFDVLATGGVNFSTSGGSLSVNNGSVGINTASPSQALEVSGAFIMVDGVQGTQAYIGNGGSGNDVEVGSLKSGITAVSMYNHTDNAYMHVYCSAITIEGGSDLAEPFQLSDSEKPTPEGAVVVIDEDHPGRLKVSDRPYDTRVAGVVSGANGVNPGIQMQQQGLLAGGKNVALTGRVYVQADASNGSIKPGDLLTTSSAAGRAMRVSDHSKAEGAILGKAMTGLKDGQGMILMLVTLQ